jgi:hypothetical protein
VTAWRTRTDRSDAVDFDGALGTVHLNHLGRIGIGVGYGLRLPVNANELSHQKPASQKTPVAPEERSAKLEP